jgi:hypothetical protein
MSSTDIISRLATRFSNAITDREHPDYLTRDIGGHLRTNQPHITGYFQVVFGLPIKLFGSDAEASTASQWLHSTCEGFTPHTQTLNHAEIQGQGQIGSSFVTSVTTTREFTLTFREYQNLPILNIIKRWSSIFDPFTGVSPLAGNKFLPINYKGWCAVAQTKPVKSKDEELAIEDLEECYIYQGVSPTNIPLDSLGSDITANDTPQHSLTFKFDNSPLTSAEPGVAAKVIELLTNLKTMGPNTTYGRYLDNGIATTQWGSHSGSVSSSITP